MAILLDKSTRLIVQGVPYVRRHIESYVGGVLEDEARALFDRFRP